MENVGDTCYLNSILSVFLNLPQFEEIFGHGKGSIADFYRLKQHPEEIENVVRNLESQMGMNLRQASNPRVFLERWLDLLAAINPQIRSHFQFSISRYQTCGKCQKKFNEMDGKGWFLEFNPSEDIAFETKDEMNGMLCPTCNELETDPGYFTGFAVCQYTELPPVAIILPAYDMEEVKTGFIPRLQIERQGTRLNLQGASVHLGSISQGHCVSVLKGAGTWELHDDSEVTNLQSPETILKGNSRPVVLVYVDHQRLGFNFLRVLQTCKQFIGNSWSWIGPLFYMALGAFLMKIISYLT